MPQIILHHGCCEVRMQITGEAPTDVYRLADQLVDLARALVRKVAEAKLAEISLPEDSLVVSEVEGARVAGPMQ